MIYCTSLKSVDLTSFNSLNIENLNEIFYNCKELKSINISHMCQRLLVLLKIALIDVTHLKLAQSRLRRSF